jgi:hypothetical protein
MVGVRGTTSPAVISGTPAGPRIVAPDRSAESESAAPGRALVAVAPVSRPEAPTPIARRVASAAFLAQLIATREQLPQTRERRRAEPGHAVNIYAATSAAPLSFAPSLSRFM